MSSASLAEESEAYQAMLETMSADPKDDENPDVARPGGWETPNRKRM